MKAAILNAIRRGGALFRMRSLEIQLDGQNQAMQSVQDEEIRIAISLARTETRRQLVKARADYLALTPAGTRRTWSRA